MNPMFVRRAWTPAEDAMLGAISDRKVAVMLGINRATARRRRLELGIEPVRPQKRRHDRVCVFCQRSFTVFGGLKSQVRTTCPAPRKCAYLQALKTKRRLKSKTSMRQLQGLMERHILRDK